MFHCFFRCHVCLSNLKQAPSRKLPLTARKTVFSHLNWNIVLICHTTLPLQKHLAIYFWILSYCDLCFVAYFRLWILVALQSETKICPSDVAIIYAGLCDLLTFFSSETTLQCKLINTTFASIVYNKVVIIIATFLDSTQFPWTTQLWCGGNFLACQQALLGLSGVRGWEICSNVISAQT